MANHKQLKELNASLFESEGGLREETQSASVKHLAKEGRGGKTTQSMNKG